MQRSMTIRILGLGILCVGSLPGIGWPSQSTGKVVDRERGTSPPNTAMLCHAAENRLNSDKLLDSPPTVEVDNKIVDRILPPKWQPGLNGSPTRVAHVVVDGRSLAPIVVDSGGTSHDTFVYVLSDDLKTLLSPPDRDARDVEHNGADDWGFGVSEDVVIVGGQPMVRSWRGRYGESPIYLSTIDRNGYIVPTCEIKKEPRKERVITWNRDNRVCHAMLARQQVPVPMHPPVSGESLVLGSIPAQFSDYGGRIRSTNTELNYHDTAMAAGVSYTLLTTGMADLDNSGKLRHIGIVSFWEGDSTAGDGTYTDSEVFPVYFDKNGVADLSASANKRLADALPHGMKNGKLVTLDKATYLELSPDTKGPSSDVWKINSSGADEICSFKLTKEVARPITQRSPTGDRWP